ncbi:MAG: transglycosylase domain-containing protein [Anaerolineae bacterium]|nr:transglycosylase domain-containing protein [Anaerolineae bacterium]
MTTTRRIIHRRRFKRLRTRTGVQLALRWLIVFTISFIGLNFLTSMFGLGSVISVYAYYAQQLPQPDQIKLESDFETTKIYDRTGQHLLYEIIDPLGGDRTWARLSDIPVDMRQATIAIEDKTFYQNPGYNAEGIARAIWTNFTSGTAHGGSSITQQLIKNTLIDPSERTALTFDRKMRELILAVRISDAWTKDEILEWYLNTNFYGNLAYGVEAAAHVYFGKPARELTLAESSMLAAIPQSPALNPIDNYDLAKERQKRVLDIMVEQGYISREQADIAFAAPLIVRPLEQRFDLLAPHFSIAARKQLETMPEIGPDLVYRGGLTVYTTLDYPLFLQIECAARSHVARLSGQSPTTVIPAGDGSKCDAADYLYPIAAQDQDIDHLVNNAAVVVMRVKTGEVLAMMGSLDYYNTAIAGNFNVATAERQPGSAIKPFTYLTAFEQGHTPATMTLDVRTAFNIGSNQPYVPENVDRQFHGPQSIRSALANSYNVPAVQVLSWVGIDSLIRTAHIMGINTLDRGLDQYGLSLTLGGGEVTLYDMTYAYSVFANMGQMSGRPIFPDQRRPGFRTLDPTLILRVEDQQGNPLWEYGKGNTFNSNVVVEPSLSYLINDILSDEEARIPSVGANSALLLDRPAAVKTGTTNDYRDNWSMGYTPQFVVGVWMGNTDNSPMQDMPAIVGAAPIWHGVMEYMHRDLPIETWQRPEDITEMTVCQVSGLLPTSYCPTRQEIFRQGSEPSAYDNVFLPFQINKETNLLATVYTPAGLVEERVYQVLPAEAADWVREAGIPQPPTEYDTLNAPGAAGNVAITAPKPFSYVKGTITVRGNARSDNFGLYRLDYGQGLNPGQWIQAGSDHLESVFSGELGLWDTAGLDGLYSLRLTVVRSDSTIQESIIQVTVDNIAPTIQVLTPNRDQTFRKADEYIAIQPIVTDNVSMDRVEFYVDDQLIATSTISPYNERWLITTEGTHVIQLRAFDAAGNTTVSERIKIEVNP